MREAKQKRDKRVYHLQDAKDVQMVGMKKKVVGLETGKYNGILSMYNFRCDPDLGIGKAACRRITCACMTYLKLLETPLDKELNNQSQPRYGINELCLYYRNFKGYNNWRVVNLITTNIATEDEEKIYNTILHGIEARMNERILIGTFGAMRTDDEATQGYYLVKWITEPYTIQEDILMKGVKPPQTAFAGEIICDALFWNPVPGAVDWYTSMTKKEGMVMIRLKQVLVTGLTMMEISERNMLPRTCNRKEATNQGAMKINDDDVKEIIEGVYRRDKFDKEFDIGLISECEEDGSNSEDEEESSDEDSD